MSGTLREKLEARTGPLDLAGVVLEISRIPYARSNVLTSDGVLDEWCGTCSTKHVLLRDLVEADWPAAEPQLYHRVYRVTSDLASRRWGVRVASSVPAEGVMDVHTYATLLIAGQLTTVDVTFSLPAWDGRSPIALACGVGEDHPAGDDVLASKAALVAEHCDPLRREPFIAALVNTQ
jgi:hypothetical protein